MGENFQGIFVSSLKYYCSTWCEHLQATNTPITSKRNTLSIDKTKILLSMIITKLIKNIIKFKKSTFHNNMIIVQMSLLLNRQLDKAETLSFPPWYLQLSTKAFNKHLKNWIKSTTPKISGFNRTEARITEVTKLKRETR